MSQSQQAPDLRRSMQIVGRHKLLVGILAALGILSAAAYAVLEPPMLASTALVAFPAPPVSEQLAATTPNGTDSYTATQEVVAGSYQVLFAALPDISPAVSFTELRDDVQVASPSPDVVSVTAKATNAAAAEATANAVAESYIRYARSAQSAAGRVQAQLLQSASIATGPAPIARTIVFALLGGLAGALAGVIVALAIGRKDRRLSMRDEIANSIGVPVLGSVRVAHPYTTGGWIKLLTDYKPTAMQSWPLRTALQQLAMPVAAGYDGDGGRFSLTVLSLSSDPGALALGPQLAVFAASQNIPTSLVIGPQQDAAAAATLRTACAAAARWASIRRGLLRVTACDDDGGVDLPPETAAVIVVAVLDGRAPKMPDTVRTGATVIGVSAGAATAEQLAAAAVAAAADGREVTGFLVADPVRTDQTTGRIPRLAHPAPRRLPNRWPGIVTEIKR
jgi:capsular polysaccharide biosynthesis protein